MKIAFVYGPMSLGARPFDFERLYDDPRGLTGSELSCLEYARAMGRRGYDVTLYVFQDAQPTWLGNDGVVKAGHVGPVGEGILLCGRDKIGDLGKPGWDAVCAWNEPDLLRGIDKGAVRLVNQQLNDFTYCQPGFSDFVDVFTSPSAHHMAFIGPQAPGTYDPPDSRWDSAFPNKWRVLPNGCDPSLYSEGKRVPGRVLWASSPDRGLHLLLQAWPLIRERVPHATLHCLYNFAPGALLGYEEGSIGLNGLPVTPDIQELARRYRYINYAMGQLGASYGVVQVGSVSRRGVVREMDEAVVLGYPCDTIRYTEGFSVTTMEACAAGLVPVITREDALASIYGALPTVLPTPISEHMGAFVELVVGALEGSAFVTAARGEGRRLAAAHAWPVLAERLESILAAEMQKKRGVLSPTDVAKLRMYAETRYGLDSPDGQISVERGPYEVEGNPVPEGARLAEWYVNHRGWGATIMRYWVTDNIMVGGSIYDAAEWTYLKKRYGLTDVLNVEAENSDRDKGIELREGDYLYEFGRQRDDGSPRSVETMLEIVTWAKNADLGAKFYVHCTHGGSRSPAYAYLLARALGGLTREEALGAIRRTRPEYGTAQFPNHVHYLKDADEALAEHRRANMSEEDLRAETSSKSKLKVLVGMVLEKAFKSNDDVYLVCSDQSVVRLRPEGDCCANCFIAGATLTDVLSGATVTAVEDLEEHSEDKGCDSVVDTWAHRIHTSRGTCTLEMRTEHNGYYRGWLNVDTEPTFAKLVVPLGAKPLEDF